MSASERAARVAAQKQKRLATSAVEGLRQTLESPDGRAFLWWFLSENADAEGKEGKGRRAVARDLLQTARLANFPCLQIRCSTS